MLGLGAQGLGFILGLDTQSLVLVVWRLQQYCFETLITFFNQYL